jgi:acetyl esterase/lipase
MSSCPARLGFVVLALVLGLLPSCRLTDVPLWGPPATPGEVVCVRDVVYWTGPGADTHRHTLDLFLPNDRTNFPVVVLVHGGAWIVGDNRCCGLYSSIGEFLARQGIGAVLPNYRLSPGVRHPEHVKDVARAVAWTCRHIAEYGGRADQLFLVGHSAGGHLVSLLTTDPQYLRAEDVNPANIRGVVGISGVYCLPPGKVDVTLGGPSAAAFRVDELFPLRGDISTECPGLSGIPLTVNPYGLAFGNDPCCRQNASPIHHVRPGLPPFLLINAAHDLPTLPEMADDFRRALVDQGDEAEILRVAERNHNSILFRAVEPDDPVARAVLDFVRRHSSPVGACGE